jgi:toxin CcdB
MAQFDVYRNRHAASREAIPYFLQLQHDQIQTRALRVVAPLIPLSRVEVLMSRLNPVFDIEGRKLVLSTLEIAGISSSFLGDDIVMSLAERRDNIIAAVDFLVTGI